MTYCKPLLALAVLIIVVLTVSLVRVENQRYAMQVGMCKSQKIEGTWDYDCLRKVQTRTSWVWHVYNALTDK